LHHIGAWALRAEPAIARACRDAARAYRSAVQFIASPPPDRR
jgi:hypothetical protein